MGGKNDGAEAGFRGLILANPLLRLYCAVPGNGSPWPPHPGYPDGTGTAAIGETGPHSVWQASEFVLRPLAVVVRIARDHGLAIDVESARCGIEVDSVGRPTGRVVVDVVADGDGGVDQAPSQEMLARYVDRLAERCTTRAQDVRGRLGAVVEQELGGRLKEPERLGSLSHARSIAHLRLSALSSRPPAQRHGVWLTPAGPSTGPRRSRTRPAPGTTATGSTCASSTWSRIRPTTPASTPGR